MMKHQICNRCGEDCYAIIMSMFNQEMICMECKKKEKAHPAYKEAAKREAKEIGKGNFNFPGVGLPKDLWRH